MSQPLRPSEYLRALRERAPDLWDQIAALRLARTPQGPEWCYVPLSHVLELCDRSIAPEARWALASMFTALSTWRLTQGVYRVHPDLLPAIWETPLAGPLPVELLYRLPEWCVYIETSNQEMAGERLHGFWAHLDWSSGPTATLRLLLDFDFGVKPTALALQTGGTLEDSLCLALQRGSLQLGAAERLYNPTRTTDELIQRDQADRGRGDAPQPVLRLLVDLPGKRAPMNSLGEPGLPVRVSPSELAADRAKDLQPLLSLVLYLCSETAQYQDARGSTERPKNPKPVRTKKDGKRGLPPKLIPASQPRVWEVSYRLGAALRAARERSEREAPETTHASPRPHVRRAHWHTFLAGPRDGERERRLRWLPPIPVGVRDLDELVPVVRPVGEDRESEGKGRAPR
jgi:hypothetical protein